MLPRFFAGPNLGRWAVKIAITLSPVFIAIFAKFAKLAIFAEFAAAGHHNPDTYPGDEIPPGAARDIAALRRQPVMLAAASALTSILVVSSLIAQTLPAAESGSVIPPVIWELVEMTASSNGPLEIAGPDRYTVQFETNDTESARAGCNRVAGTYSAGDSARESLSASRRWRSAHQTPTASHFSTCSTALPFSRWTRADPLLPPVAPRTTH